MPKRRWRSRPAIARLVELPAAPPLLRRQLCRIDDPASPDTTAPPRQAPRVRRGSSLVQRLSLPLERPNARPARPARSAAPQGHANRGLRFRPMSRRISNTDEDYRQPDLSNTAKSGGAEAARI